MITAEKIPGARHRVLAWSCLFISASMILGVRIWTFGEPLDRDLATYCLIGDELIKGRRLYSDIWDHKPPAVYWTCAAAELLVGYGKPTAFALGIATALATLAAVYRSGVLLGGETAGICASLLWAVACGDLDLQANQPNVEAFLNALISWAFVLSIGLDRRTGGIPRSLAAGILIGVSSAYKPVTAFIAVPLALAGVAHPPGRPGAWSQLLAMALPSLIIWAGLCIGFSWSGRWDIFFSTIIRYNAYYAGDIASNLASSLGGPRAEDLMSRQVLYPLAILTAPAFAFGLRGRARLLFAAWLLGTHLAVASPGMSFPHYFQLWLPPLAIGAGCGVVAMPRRTAGMTRIAACIFITFNIFWICAIELNNLRSLPTNGRGASMASSSSRPRPSGVAWAGYCARRDFLSMGRGGRVIHVEPAAAADRRVLGQAIAVRPAGVRADGPDVGRARTGPARARHRLRLVCAEGSQPSGPRMDPQSLSPLLLAAG